MHLQDAPDAFFLALPRVVDRVARAQHARVDAEERQVPDERVRRDLESQRRERLAIVRVALALRFFIDVALDGRHIDRRRHVIDNRVEHRLHTLVLECRAAHRHDDLTRQRTCTQAPANLVFRQLSVLEELVEQRLICFRRSLDHLLAPLVSGIAQFCGDLAGLKRGAHIALVPVDRLHAHEVDNTGKLLFRTNRQLDRHRVGTQAIANLLHHAQVVGAGAIHLVDEDHARHFVLVTLAPDGLGLRLHAAD